MIIILAARPGYLLTDVLSNSTITDGSQDGSGQERGVAHSSLEFCLPCFNWLGVSFFR